jgi:hypothetical protein
MVDVWYPADSRTGPAARYLDVAAFEQALGTDGLRQQLGNAYDAIKSAGVRTHTVENSPFSKSIKQAPFLIFSPGGGMVRELYAAQLEDLASYGYIIAAISHTYDASVVVFPDGRQVVYDSKRWPAVPSFEGDANLNQLEWHAADISFILDELIHLNAADSSHTPIAGHLDLDRVGAFGHSFGGIASAHACQKDQRIKACLNQDGAVAMRPFYLDARGWGMDQPFMLIERNPRAEPPSDKELAEMKISRERANEIVSRLRENRDRILRRTGGGTYRVLLNRGTTTHMDFSDLPLLGTGSAAETETRARVLETIGSYTRAFFDKYLKGIRVPLLEGQQTNDLVEAVQRFPPAQHQNIQHRRDRAQFYNLQ